MAFFRSIPIKLMVAGSICFSLLILAAILNFQTFRGARIESMHNASTNVRYLTEIIKLSMQNQTIPIMNSLNFLDQGDTLLPSNLTDSQKHLPLIVESLHASPIISVILLGYESGELMVVSKSKPYSFLLSGSMPDRTSFIVQTINLNDNHNDYIALTFFYDNDFALLEKRATPDYFVDPRTRPWYIKAKAEKGIIFTPPYAFYPSKQIGVTIAKSMSKANGVVGIGIVTQNLNSIFNDLLITPNSKIVLVDKQGTIIAYSSTVLKKTDSNITNIFELNNNIFDGLLTSKRPELEVEIYNDGNANWYGLTSSLSATSGNHYTLLVAIPERELLADAWSNIYQQFLISLIIVLLLMLAGWYFGSRIVDPLRKLASQAEAFKNFNYIPSTKIPTRIKEVRELKSTFEDMLQTINALLHISLVLNKEPNLEVMLSRVLQELLQVVHLESGAIYLYDHHDNQLHLAVHHGMGYPASIPVNDEQMSDDDIIRYISDTSAGEPLVSVLRNREKDLIGLLYIDYATGVNQENAFIKEQAFLNFLQMVSGAAAIAIETRQLILSHQTLLQGFIKLLAEAIDAKSHYTGGHCLRVPELSIMMMDALNDSGKSPYPDFSMTPHEEEEFRIAAWLHDCGKITTPENVVDKATKLECIYNRIHEIRTRFEVLHRDATIACLEDVVKGKDPAEAEAERDRIHAKLQDDFAFTGACNLGVEEMSTESIQRLKDIGKTKWQRHFQLHHGIASHELVNLASTLENIQSLPAEENLLDDKSFHLIPWAESPPPVQPGDKKNTWGFNMRAPQYMANLGEVYNLCIRRGTLTAEERFRINGHIVQTIIMLKSLDFPRHLKRIPDIAGNHHEKMDGTGYPRKLNAKTLSIPERVIAIADVFEALTAADRPYKSGKTLSESLRILSKMAKEGHLDPVLVNFFITSKLYLEYAKIHLEPSQIDTIREEDYLVDIPPDM